MIEKTPVEKFEGKAVNNMSALTSLLGTENVRDLKKRIADQIVARVASDLRDYDQYLFYPADYQKDINEAYEKVQKKISKMYTDAMLETAQLAVEKFKDIALATFTDTPGLVRKECIDCVYHKGNRCRYYANEYSWEAHDGQCAKDGYANFKAKESSE